MEKITNIEVLIITRQHSNNPTGLPVYQAYIEGALSVQNQVQLSGRVSYSSYEANGNHPDFPNFNVRHFPTILFIDKATKKTLVRIDGNSITSENVAYALRVIDNWFRDESTGKYLDNEGEEVRPGGDGVFSVLPGEGYNMGIPPIDLPNVVWWVLTGIGAYYAAESKNTTQKILIGSGTVYAFSKAINKPLFMKNYSKFS